MSSSCSCTKDEWGRCCCMYQGANKSSLPRASNSAGTELRAEPPPGQQLALGSALRFLCIVCLLCLPGQHCVPRGPAWGGCTSQHRWAAVPGNPGQQHWGTSGGLHSVSGWSSGECLDKPVQNFRVFSKLGSPGRYFPVFPVEFL